MEEVKAEDFLEVGCFGAEGFLVCGGYSFMMVRGMASKDSFGSIKGS